MAEGSQVNMLLHLNALYVITRAEGGWEAFAPASQIVA